MLELLQAAFYMGGSFVFIGLLFLPAVLLVVVSAVYIISEAIHNFRARRRFF
ncbi:hypothetical protein [Dysosmobacter sp.]